MKMKKGTEEDDGGQQDHILTSSVVANMEI